MSKPQKINIQDWWGMTIINTSAGDIPKSDSYPPSVRMRKFILKVWLPDNEHGGDVEVWGRTNFEAGFNVLLDALIPVGYVAHSLIEAPRGV